VVFPSHTEKVFHLKLCVLCLWCLDIYFAYIYIALFGSFLVDSHKEGVWALLLLPLVHLSVSMHIKWFIISIC
jgi:hypothetical protein